MEDDRDRFPWGCSCGRLCQPEDDECESCGGAFSAEKLIRSEPARRRFLKGAERRDRRVLEGAAARFVEVEESYRGAAGEFERHARGEQHLDGLVAKDGMGVAIFGDAMYGDAFDAFYSDNDPWMWG